MRWRNFLMPVLASSFVLAGCGDKEEVENPPKEAPTEGEKSTENQKYPFTKFELEADYEKTKDSMEIEYENKKTGVEATFIDQENKVNLKGDEAMKELDKKFQSFTFDEKSSDEEIISQVEKEFKVPKAVKSLELEIKFAGGTEKEIKK